MQVDAKQLNGLTLAYVGDAIYELYIRTHLIASGYVKPDILHQKAVQFVSANAQATIVHKWLDNDVLTQEEEAIVRRGRNAKSISTPKNMSVQAYRYATGLEALFGYHYLQENKERLDKLAQLAIKSIENEDGNDHSDD